jgi:HPt (histidine-containing phosphotransfer) domain-containing protein
MSNDENKLQQQIADIGTRYLKRTLGEVGQLRAYLEQARSGSADALKEIERMAHKIHGSGAMFGFDAVSERADELERIAAQAGRDRGLLQSIEGSIAALESQVQQDAQVRGIK